MEDKSKNLNCGEMATPLHFKIILFKGKIVWKQYQVVLKKHL